MPDVKKFYNIYNLEDDKVVVDIDGVIGSYWEGSDESKNTKAEIRNFLNDVKAKKAKTILVRISSPGGSVDHGLTIHDALKQHPANIEVEVYGMTASAATVISQAADPGKLKMSKNSLFLIHEAWMGAIANKTEMKSSIETLETIDGILAGIYSDRSGKELEEVVTLMGVDNGNGKWLNAEDAKEFGLIDEILQVETDKNNIENHKDFHNKFAAMGGKIPMPEINKTATINNNVEEVNSMENEKLFTAADMEAAKKEVVENVSKHLGWIDKAENATILENIKSGANYADCVEAYAEEKISKIENANRIEDMQPENLEHVDAADSMEKVGDDVKKEESSMASAEKLGLIRK